MRRFLTWMFRWEFRLRNRTWRKRTAMFYAMGVRQAENFWVDTRMTWLGFSLDAPNVGAPFVYSDGYRLPDASLRQLRNGVR